MSSMRKDSTLRPNFFVTVPLMNPRSECGCQLVAFSRSLAVAPPGRFSSSRIISALLPARTPFTLAASLRSRGAAGSLRALARFLGRAGLLPRLGLGRRDVARTFGDVGLFRLGGRRGLGGFGFFDVRDHFDFLLSQRLPRRSHSSLGTGTQAREFCRKPRWRKTGDGPPAPRRGEIGAPLQMRSALRIWAPAPSG